MEDREDISAIVIGYHEKSDIKEMPLGGVSKNVIRGSKRLLLVVKR